MRHYKYVRSHRAHKYVVTGPTSEIILGKLQDRLDMRLKTNKSELSISWFHFKDKLLLVDDYFEF